MTITVHELGANSQFRSVGTEQWYALRGVSTVVACTEDGTTLPGTAAQFDPDLWPGPLEIKGPA